MHPRGFAVGRAEKLGGPAQGHALEREADREQLAQFLDVEARHLGPVMGHVICEPERLELAHRFPDRGDAHPERPCEILQPERGSGRELTHDDRLTQAFQGGLRHRPVSDGGAFGDWEGGLHRGGA